MMPVTEQELDRNLEALLWWKGIKETNNETFWPLFFDEHRYLVLCGGGGSGKSIFAGRKLLERVTSEPGHRWLVVRKVAKTLRESCWRQLLGQIGEYYGRYLKTVNQGDMRITFVNGSEILFSGLDDVEKLKSIFNITGIWIEEASELLEEDFSQLDIRLRGETAYYKQIIVSFNPISIMHWLKRRFFDTADDRATTHRSTYKDNRFLDDEAKKTLERFKESDPYYYQVYCLGEWGVTGKTIFNAQAVTRRLGELQPPETVGRFVDTEWFDDETGNITIYTAPQPGVPYVIGADTAGDGSDYSVAHVLDNTTGEQVAVLRQQSDEGEFTDQLYCLGRFYNDALIGVEVNFSTYTVLELERRGYPRQYVRQAIDTFTHKPTERFGFRTTQSTRETIISELVDVLRDDIELVNDRPTLEEMLTFVRNEKMRAEAEKGAHDDCIMSLAIAHFIRPQMRTTIDITDGKLVEWSASMWEDYDSASAAEKTYLIEKWGKPRRRT